MFKSVTSTKLVAELEDRARRMASGVVGACLKVPPEHKWWVYQENGTAAGYPIFPVAKKALAWMNPDGSHAVLPYVGDHPGVTAKHFVLDSMPTIKLEVIKNLGPLVQSFNTGNMQTVLETTVMPLAKSIILDNVKLQLPGTRAAGPNKGEPAGKLGGKSAAEVLEAVITIEPLS